VTSPFGTLPAMEATVRAEPESNPPPTGADPTADLVEEELLVEEISIDGMCGVY